MDDARTMETMLRPPLGRSTMLLFGIFAAPLAWAVQLVASYALAASSCFSRGVALIGDTTPGRMPLAVIALACALPAIAGLVVAMQQHRDASAASDAHHATRSRALAAVGILSSMLFLGAIAFSIVMLSLSPRCAG